MMEEIDIQGRKVIVACQSLHCAEQEAFLSKCEELTIWMTSQQRMVLECGQEMTRKDMEELKQSQTINKDLAEEMKKKVLEVSGLENTLPDILARCDEEEGRQARDMMDR